MNIPPQVAYAAGKAAYEKWVEQIRDQEAETLGPEMLEDLCPAWEDLSDNNQKDWISQSTEAILAGIAAWPGMENILRNLNH